MANVFTWIIVGFLGLIIVLGLIGGVVLVLNRMRREQKGDIFLMPSDTRDGSPPIELRTQRDYRYKDAGVDPYQEEPKYDDK